MTVINRYLSAFIIISAIILNLFLYRAETQIKADPNDNAFQYSLVGRTNWVWENYGCPWKAECLPNLVDHNVTYWAEGYSLPFYYSHLPQIAIVASYNLIVKPLSQLISIHLTLYTYYNLTKYLLLSFFPLPVFLAFLLVGFPPVPSALSAFFAGHLSTDGLYGIDPPSFLWRGWGLTSQLYAIFFMPLALAYIYRSLSKNNNFEARNSKHESNQNVKNSIFPNLNFVSIFDIRISDLILAIIFLTLTTAGHLGIGIITLLSVAPMIFLDFNKRNIINRVKKLFLILSSFFFLLSYWIIPILLYNRYHIISFWDPIWKFNSYGWYEVVRQLLNGEIFDHLRPPILTGLILTGLFVLLLNPRYFVFSLIFILMMLLYFGRTTWGSLIDFIPGMKDFHLHRFIVGVHITSLFLLPMSLDFLFSLVKKLTNYLRLLSSSSSYFSSSAELKTIISYSAPVTGFIIFSVFAYQVAKQTVNYNSLNHRWINEANTAFDYDEKNFLDLVDYIKSRPSARTYAGRPGNWGHDLRLGSSQIYMLLSVYGLDMSQFLPETWSMMSENDQNFDERAARDYDLLNIRYIISADNHEFPESAEMVKKFGPFQLYEIPTSGWFDVVQSPMFVTSDKTNFINLVHLWHRGYPRTWKMHPLISIEKNPPVPSGMQKQIKMLDEVTYSENPGNTHKNIFADFPFVFPDSTVSAKIRNETVEKQTYSARITVPQNCRNCMYMFKMSYHPNWQVKVDGQTVEKFAVFPMYVAARAAPGVHTVSVTHKPNSLKSFLLILELVLIPAILYFI